MIYDKPKHRLIDFEKIYSNEFQLGANLVIEKSQIYLTLSIIKWNIYIGWMLEI